jgi:hypothetical protein
MYWEKRENKTWNRQSREYNGLFLFSKTYFTTCLIKVVVNAYLLLYSWV